MNKYILDTNVLISAYRTKYPFDVMPSFWKNLLLLASKVQLILIDEVENEIKKNEDALNNWLQTNKDKFIFLQSDDFKVIDSYRLIIQGVIEDEQYTEKAKEDYASSADSWVIAHAHANNYIIVTEEVYDKNIKRRIKIPNVCRKHDIKCINTLEFLREMLVKI